MKLPKKERTLMVGVLTVFVAFAYANIQLSKLPPKKPGRNVASVEEFTRGFTLRWENPTAFTDGSGLTLKNTELKICVVNEEEETVELFPPDLEEATFRLTPAAYQFEIVSISTTNVRSLPALFNWVVNPFECNADFNESGSVNFVDLARLAGDFLLVCNDCATDLNEDGRVNFLDFALFRQAFGTECFLNEPVEFSE